MIYCEKENYKLYQGSMLDILPTFEENSVDAIVTDPPYEINFMNNKWDNSGIAFKKETWEQCLRVLKPGGYLLAFGGSRTFHRIACAIEDAGFEIRDILMWLYGSGFPKGQNVGLAIDKKLGIASKIIGKVKGTGNPGRENNGANIGFITKNQYEDGTYDLKEAQNDFEGYNTCLKPAYEPIIMARKPLVEKTIAENMIKYKTGSINIEECRVEKENKTGGVHSGKYPANVIISDSEEIDEYLKSYFYCAKASTKDRDEGLEQFETTKITDGCVRSNQETAHKFGANPAAKKNIHTTVKPTELMQYLIRLVAPKGAIVLDCFNGSGSTGKACMFENRERNANYFYIGIELTEKYLSISEARIEFALNKYKYDETFELQDGSNKKIKQLSIFEL